MWKENDGISGFQGSQSTDHGKLGIPWHFPGVLSWKCSWRLPIKFPPHFIDESPKKGYCLILEFDYYSDCTCFTNQDYLRWKEKIKQQQKESMVLKRRWIMFCFYAGLIPTQRVLIYKLMPSWRGDPNGTVPCLSWYFYQCPGWSLWRHSHQMCEGLKVGSRENVLNQKVRTPEDVSSLEFWTKCREKVF